MRSGDLVVFDNQRPHPSMEGWYGRLALVLESEMRPVFPSEPNGDMYERVTVLLNEGRIATSPARNWRVIEGAQNETQSR